MRDFDFGDLILILSKDKIALARHAY